MHVEVAVHCGGPTSGTLISSAMLAASMPSLGAAKCFTRAPSMTVGGTAKACRVPAWWLTMLPDVHNLSLQLPGSIFRESLMSRSHLLKYECNRWQYLFDSMFVSKYFHSS